MEEGARADGSSMLCYISAHEGFYGTIKNCTSDFVVTEIDVNGELVNSEDYLGKRSYPPPESSARLCCRGPKTEDRSGDVAARNCVAERTSGARVDGRDSDPTLVCEEPLDLELVLGHSVNEELEEFVSKSGAGEELSLGTFPDKRRRASLHRAVRHHYPHLMTRTNKSEILVKEDPNYKELSCLVSQEESENFFRFLDAKVPGSVFTFKQDDSKEHRKAVHHFLSKCFGKLVETKSFSSSNGDGSQGTAITVRFREKSTQTRKRTAADREDEGVRYAAFTLRKENLETLEAISYMATWLGVLPSDFTYAGIKDKRATTYQSMVVKKVSPQRLEEMSATFEKKGILLSHIRPVPEPLRLGALLGNHFDLVVRDVRVHHGDGRSTLQQIVLEALDNVKANGFVNYYGPQRFGTGQSVRADLVGLALLKHEMDVAVRLFFTPEEGDDPQNVAKRHFLNTGNAKESLTLMPEHKARERLLLRALHRYGSGPDGCTRAWLSLPHSTRVFYVHAYCSRLWNEGTTYRLQQFGHRVVQGDLVLDSRAPGERGNESPPQVVLPMPGNTVKYPENAVGAWYRERLASDGLRDCRFRVTPLKLNVPGCYRPVLAVPRNVTQELRDLEDDPAAPSLALSFDLDSSCYATVCLREIMKCVA
ncbi:pseudouridylate synthase PUS7L isoform X3 [Scleropages formosus]|uniref:Pseudouridylate synthase PUS7L n=1 Tax=Scleropages formosus TaxID=113540 RepID=A0A8C9UZD9_SCLFO|nr:pseudouridylate synthase 7 homolog-like protein isoform X3 [Scleropages formosus]